MASGMGPDSPARIKEAAALPRQTNAECNFTQPQVHSRAACGTCFSCLVSGRMSDLADRRGRVKSTLICRGRMLARDRDCSVSGWARLRHSVLPLSLLHGLLKLQTCELGINGVRLRVGGGTGQALCIAVKQPTDKRRQSWLGQN